MYNDFTYDSTEEEKVQMCKEEAYGYYFTYYVFIENEIDSIINAFKEAELTNLQVNSLTDNCDELAELLLSYDSTFDYVDFLYELKVSSDQIILVTYNVINDFDDVIIDSLESMDYKDDNNWKSAHDATVALMETITLHPIFAIFDTITDEQLEEFLELGQITLGTILDYSYSLDEIFDILENNTITESNLQLILSLNAKSFSDSFGKLTKEDITKVLSFINDFNNALTGSTEEVNDTTVDMIYRSIKSIESTFNYLSTNTSDLYKLIEDYNYIMNTDYSSLNPFEKVEFENELVLFDINCSILTAKLMNNVLNNNNLLSYDVLKSLDIDLTMYKSIITKVASYSYYDDINDIYNSTLNELQEFNSAFEYVVLTITERIQRLFITEEYSYNELQEFLYNIESGQYDYNYNYFWESADKEDCIIINVRKSGNITYCSNFNTLTKVDEVVYIRENDNGTIDTQVNGVLVDYTYVIEDELTFDINNFEYLGEALYIYNNPNDLYDGMLVDVLYGAYDVYCVLESTLDDGSYQKITVQQEIGNLYF